MELNNAIEKGYRISDIKEIWRFEKKKNSVCLKDMSTFFPEVERGSK